LWLDVGFIGIADGFHWNRSGWHNGAGGGGLRGEAERGWENNLNCVRQISAQGDSDRLKTMAFSKAHPLVRVLATGEPEGYAILYDRLSRSMLRAACAMLGASDEAEDTVQDVFVELVRRRDRLGQVQDLDAYVFAMLRNGVRRRLERRVREEHHLRQIVPAGAEEPGSFFPDELTEALKTLPAEQREVVALKIDGGLTFAQIAGILDVNPNTAASRYRYAIEKLREVLE
jgi:RNA polymerase sigma-70 factor (ECF subfamily)